MPATPYHDTPVVDKPWDGPGAEAAIPNTATAGTLSRLYAWRDPTKDADTKGAYKLPHHEVSNGEASAANVNGVRAALSRVAQQNTQIPDADVGAIRSHLMKHMAKFNNNSSSSSDLFETGLMVRTWGATWAVRRELMAQLQREHGRVLAGELVELAAAQPARSSPRVQGGVAVIPLRGLITPGASLLSLLFGGSVGGLAGFRADLQSALDNDDVRSILINVDSPGGLVDQVPETADAIRQARDEKPVVAVANTLAASAAYWLASQAHEVVTTNSGELGSIGIYQVHEDVSGALENEGVKVSIISAGRYKTEGNPFEPLADDARDYSQQVVDDYYSQFVNAVAAGRGADPQAVRDGFGQGRVLTAKRAVSAGLADRVATYDQTFSRLAGGRARVRQTGNGNGNGSTADELTETYANFARPHVVRAADFAYTDEEKDRLLTTLAGLR